MRLALAFATVTVGYAHASPPQGGYRLTPRLLWSPREFMAVQGTAFSGDSSIFCWKI